jgi:cytochrome P450
LSNPAVADPISGFSAALQNGSYYEDPAPVWAALRQTGSMVKLPVRGEPWACTTWGGCASLARDPRLSSARSRSGGYSLALPPEHRHEMKPFLPFTEEAVFFLDPPRHSRVRKILNRAFTPELVEQNRPRITRLFDDLLDDWIASGDGEIMAKLIHPFPAMVIADWMGLPRTDWPRFMTWGNAIVRLLASITNKIELDDARTCLRLFEENREYLTEVVQSRAAGGSDLFGLLMEMEEGEVLDRGQLVAQAMFILAAGHETTRNLIGCAVHWPLSNACDYREFLGDDVSQRLAVDELLRLSSPVPLIARVVTQDFEFEGAQLKKGEIVLFAFVSANRDPAQFCDPDRMDLRRRNNPHLAFGAGAHACLGLHLARVEAQVALERLWTRLPNLRLASPAPEWNRLFNVHGPVRLHVAFDH